MTRRPARETPDRIAVRSVVVRWAGAEGASERITRTKEQAFERAEMLAGLLRDPGSRFVELARQYGDGMDVADRAEDGRVIARDSEGLEPTVVREAFALGIGEVSVPVETPRGYVLVGRIADPPVGPRQIAARHILIQFVGSRSQDADVERTRDEARALAQEVVEKLRAGEDWNRLAVDYTDEPGGAERFGDLGTFGRGAMVPAFERVAFQLEIDQISDVVESDFGFHVIKRYR